MPSDMFCDAWEPLEWKKSRIQSNLGLQLIRSKGDIRCDTCERLFFPTLRQEIVPPHGPYLFYDESHCAVHAPWRCSEPAVALRDLRTHCGWYSCGDSVSLVQRRCICHCPRPAPCAQRCARHRCGSSARRRCRLSPNPWRRRWCST